MTVHVGIIEFNSEQYIESVALRDLVLRKPLNLHFSQEDLAKEGSDYHIGATDGDQIVGILLLTPLGDKRLKMRQVAVHPKCQGEGIGKKLVDFAEDFAIHLDFDIMELNARKTAVPFYLTKGYHTIGDEFVEVGIPHFKMSKGLER